MGQSRAAILGLVEAAWGKSGTADPAEGTVDSGSASNNQQTARGGSGKAPGYGARKGERKPTRGGGR